MKLNALVALLAVSLVGSDPVADQYPPPLQIAPPNDGWTKAVLQGKNTPNNPASDPKYMIDYNLGWSKCANNNDWAVTYDDGPTQFTPQLLQALAKRNVKATFFVLGMQVVQFPQFLKDAYNAGHQIGIHTWSHKHMTTLTNDQIVSEIVWTAKAIKETIGVTPVYFRPPFGDMDERVHDVIVAMGLRPVLWNFVSGDANTPTNPNLVADMTAEAQKSPKFGHISLEHDIQQLYVDEAIQALDAVIAAGYSMKAMDDCLQEKNAYDESFWAKFNMNVVSGGSKSNEASSSSSGTPAPSSTVRNNGLNQSNDTLKNQGNGSAKTSAEGTSDASPTGPSFIAIMSAIAFGVFSA